MTSMHIKLGLTEQCITALDKKSVALKYFQDFFSKLSEAKIKAGVFIGSQINKTLQSKEFPKKLASEENVVWNGFVAVGQGFLGNQKMENYVELVELSPGYTGL